MENQVSLYRVIEEPIVIFHNKNILPPIHVPHLHSRYEFCYNIKGADGMLADKKRFHCSGHDLFFIPKTCVHKILVKKDTCYERCVVNIDSGIVDEINGLSHLSQPLAWLESRILAVPRRVILSDSEHRLFVSLVDDYNNQGKSALYRYGKFLEIMAFLEEKFRDAENFQDDSGQPNSVAEQALILIEENFSDIKVAELSKRLYVNSSYLGAQFKEEYGVTLEQYLLIRKIAEAKKYLYMGTSVKDACALAGFGNYANFVRTFKKFEGCTPSNLSNLSAPL